MATYHTSNGNKNMGKVASTIRKESQVTVSENNTGIGCMVTLFAIGVMIALLYFVSTLA